ncbi:MAG: HEAT repeat domain-containing protein, partial [Phycisphaerae bacterium]|nr:HEAT repeat domain-containing protein [Phycisphaerae bacterium]
MTERFRLLRHFFLITAAAVLLPGGQHGTAAIHPGDGIDLPMDRQPLLPTLQKAQTYNPAYLALWHQALAEHSIQVRCQVCEALAHAGRAKFPGLTPFLTTLEDLAAGTDEKPALRQSAVQTLTAINNPSAAPAVLEAEKRGGIDVALEADPALVRWHYKPALKWWRSQLRNRHVEAPVEVSAITSLMQFSDQNATSQLRQLVLNEAADIRIRLAAAKALAKLHAKGVGGMAEKLLAGHGPIGLQTNLLALWLVSQGRNTAQQHILAALARNENLAVRVIAVRCLLRANWHELSPDAQALAKARSSTMRLLAAQLARREKNVAILARLLNDARRPVRWYAREALVRLGRETNLAAPIEHILMQLLPSSHPRQQRQAALALGLLNYQPAAGALLHLLHDNSHPGVRLGALVALRRLAAPDTLAALLVYARHDAGISRRMADPKMRSQPASAVQFRYCGDELAQLLQLFGKTRYRPASGLMEKFIPKHSPYDVTARAAAIWALGKIYAGNRKSPLVELFQGRLADESLMDPEAPVVRRMAAISLARLGSTASLSELQGFYVEEPTSPKPVRCRWSAP